MIKGFTEAPHSLRFHGLTMLEFAESILRDYDRLIKDTETMVLSGGVSDMERYRFLMGRLEGLKLARQSVKDRLKKQTDEEI